VRPGNQVRWTASGEIGTVIKTVDTEVQVRFGDSSVRWVHHSELEHEYSYTGAIEATDLLAQGDLGEAKAYALRLQALFLKHAYRFDPLSGLSNARIEPKLHQVFVAHMVATQKLRPRMILADEVGLGKTIEAGLILKELKARKMIERILVVTPASLLYQWQHELNAKFNERFEILDGPALNYLGKDGGNPWLRHHQVICSLPLAQRRAEKLIEAGWDLVVFDEAHRVRRSGDRPDQARSTLAYRLADELKEHITGLLLLTATPMQLHFFELFSLIELVEPGLFRDWRAYTRVRRETPVLNDLMRELRHWRTLDDARKHTVAAQHETLLVELGIDAQDCLQAAVLLDDDVLRETTMDALVKRHPHVQVMVRNRKAEVGGFMKRSAVRVLIDATQDERAAYSLMTSYLIESYGLAERNRDYPLGFLTVMFHKLLASSPKALKTSLERRVNKLRQAATPTSEQQQPAIARWRLEELKDAPEAIFTTDDVLTAGVSSNPVETEVARLQAIIGRLDRLQDSKLSQLIAVVRAILEEDPSEKILIFTQFVETQLYLQESLHTEGFSVAIFNGRQNAEQKEDAVRRFRQQTQILVSTEAGGEGRNFQFCHFLVNYDLPWNPMKVEQRIGRLDRIGQTRVVFIYNLALAGTVEERVLNVLEYRIGLFEESVGSLDVILGEVESDIEQLVRGHATDQEAHFARYEIDIEQRVREAREAERTLADFVMDRASFRRDEANALLARSPLGRHTDLRSFVGEALAYFGGALDADSEGGDVISLPPALLRRARGVQGTVLGVFDPEVAVKHEDRDFFAFGHPAIDTLVEFAANEAPQLTAARRDGNLPKGIYVEVFYEHRAEGLKGTARLVRHVVAENGSVTPEIVGSMPPMGRPARVHVPDWVSGALDASKRQAMRESAALRSEHSEFEEYLRERELERAKRIYDYQEHRLQQIINEEARWVARVESQGTDRERRVLPARSGKLRKDRQRLSDLTDRYAEEVRSIRGRQAGVYYSVLAAGIVQGTG
jgi:superfamily II DNA or RNA helicase